MLRSLTRCFFVLATITITSLLHAQDEGPSASESKDKAPTESKDKAPTESKDGEPSTSEEASTPVQGKPLKLDISRRFLKNFLTDDVALIPHKGKEGEIRDLQGVFMVGAVQSSHAAFWDPVSCRLLGALNLKKSEDPDGDRVEGEEASSPYTLLASGAHPLNGSRGTFENPKYFGFRVVNGRPEFLYTFGSLQVEEQVWLEDDGKTLKQRIFARGAKSGFTLSFPPNWKSRCDPSVGEWKDNTLTVPADAAEPLTLTFQLNEQETATPPEN